jgi:L-malate glycosyltransferase
LKSQSSRSERTLVIISGYYGFDNLGDEAILEEITNELKRLVDAQDILVLSKNPAETSRLYGVQSANRFDVQEIFKLLSKARLFISGGGGLFQDTTSSKSVIYYAALLFMAKLAGCKSMVYAQGIGPLQGKLSKALTQKAFGCATEITVRDDRSLQLLRSWRLLGELTADPVWNLEEKETSQTVNLHLAALKAKYSFLVGLSLRESPVFKEEMVDVLAQILKDSLPANSYVLLLPLQAAQDVALLKRAQEKCTQLGLECGFLPEAPGETASQWLPVFDKVDLVVGMRLHALILALKRGKPVVGIAYDPKVEHLMSEFNQTCIRLSDGAKADSQIIWKEAIQGTLLHIQEFAQKTIEKRQDLEKMACKNFAIVAKILGS